MIHSSCISFLIFDLNACFAADLLRGNGLVSSLGSLYARELLWVMAFLARVSAFSLPSTPSCAGTHLIQMDSLGSFFFMVAIALWKVSSK